MFTRLPRVPSMLQEVGILPILAYFQFFGWKWSDVRVPVKRPLPLRLGEDKGLP